MIVELTPETYFENTKIDGPLHMVMHYGASCGPCKITMPVYELVAQHFLQNNVTNIRFYKFHQWQDEYQEFINKHDMKPSGVPCFRYYYSGEMVDDTVGSYPDPNILKKKILDVCDAIYLTMGGFDLYKKY